MPDNLKQKSEFVKIYLTVMCPYRSDIDFKLNAE
jgi:hypothetical protein